MATRQLRNLSAVVGIAMLSACGAHTSPPAPPRPTASPTSRVSAPAVVPLGVRPFGLPVDIGPASVVVRALTTYRPNPPLPGRAGTPVRAQVVINVPAGERPALRAELRDPQTGRVCVERFGVGGRPPKARPGHTARLAFSFLCPETVRSDLVVTVSVGAAHQAFLGPLG